MGERNLKMKRLVLILVIIPCLVWSQEQAKQDPWDQLSFFAGSWEGEVSGKAGIGIGERSYEFILQGQFLHVKNKATFEPQEKNPEGEVHEDWGVFSYDGGRKMFVFRQFHVEGFVNQYALDSASSDGKTLVFVTEGIENIPDGWRAKLTFIVENDDSFIEQFQLAPPGKDFGTCIENRWKRK
jgi:hypothetical protein